MKISNLFSVFSVGTAVFVLSGAGAQAQMPGPGGPAGMSAALTKLFGEVKAFSAKAEVRVLDGSQTEMASMPMNFAFLDGKVRVDIDMTQAKASNMPPGMGEQLKQMGLSQVVSVVRPDKQSLYLMYPDQKSMLTMPLPKEDSAAAAKDLKLDKTEIGKETLDGEACVKYKVLIPDNKGGKIEAFTWNATGKKDFPIQIQTKDKENTSIVRFKQLEFAKPDTAKFDPPAGYTQYTNQQEMMQGIMSKMMQQGADKK